MVYTRFRGFRLLAIGGLSLLIDRLFVVSGLWLIDRLLVVSRLWLIDGLFVVSGLCLLYTSPSPRD